MSKLGETYFRYRDLEDPKNKAKGVIKRNHARIGSKYIGGGFNDIDFYRDLMSTKGCKNVELAAIGVLAGLKLREIYSIYRITLHDGSTEMYDSMGSCLADSSCWDKGSRNLIIFQTGEHLKGIVAHERDGSLTGLTFVTNRRRVRIVGNSFDETLDSHRNMTNNPPGMKIIAFCGNCSGNMIRHPIPPALRPILDSRLNHEIGAIGFYMIPFRWKARRIYVLMRQLVQRNRAQSTSTSELATIMKRLCYLELDLFRTVSRFL